VENWQWCGSDGNLGSKYDNSGDAMAALTRVRAVVDRSVIFTGMRGEQMNMNRSIDAYERWRFDFTTALHAFISSTDTDTDTYTDDRMSDG
jgi:hypothetical protein